MPTSPKYKVGEEVEYKTNSKRTISIGKIDSVSISKPYFYDIDTSTTYKIPEINIVGVVAVVAGRVVPC